MKKNKVIGLLATISCTLALAGGLSVNSASATGKTVDGVDVSSFAMEEGASARFGALDGQNGIRFTAHMDKDKYEALESKESDTVKVNYGMLIVPADIVTDHGDLTPASVFGATGATYSTAPDCDATDKATVCGTCQKVHIASITYDVMSDVNKTDGLVDLRGSLVGIKESNINREMAGIAYIEYDNNGTKSYTFANDLADNERSMTYVAQVAIKNGNDDANKTLYNTYVKPLANNNYKYTVNHYLPTGTDGAYEFKGTETLSGKLSDNVTATNIFKSTLADRTNYKAYADYSFDTTKGVVSDILYANGRTVLNCYYKVSDKVLWSASDAEDVAGMSKKNNASEYPTGFNPTAVTEHGSYATTVASYTDGTGATSGTAWKFTTTQAYGWGSGKLAMFFDENKLAVAESANWDYLKVRMCVVIDRNKDNSTDMDLYVGDATPIIGGTDHSGINQKGIALNTWVDVIVPKAVLNNPNTFVLARNKITTVQDKQGFDDVFRAYTTSDTYNETNFFWFSDNVGPATEGNNATSVDVVPTLTYYIETIEWGVDVEAPEFNARPLRAGSYQLIHTDIDAIHTANGKYSGIFEVTDDIIPTLQHNLSTYVRPNLTAKIYKVVDSVRTEVMPVNGAYTFEEGVEYEADVTVDDRAVTNVACNTRTETVKLTVLGDNDIFSANSKGDASVFIPKQFGTGLLNTYEYVDSYKDGANVTKDGVVKATTHAWWSGSKNESWGGYVNGNFGLSTAQITAITTAIADSTKSVTINFDLCVVKPAGSTISINTLNAQSSAVNYTINYNTWSTVTFDMSTWTDANEVADRLNGTKEIMSLQGAWTGAGATNADSELHIYIDKIYINIVDLSNGEVFSANSEGDEQVFISTQFGTGLLNTYEYVVSYKDGANVTKDGVVIVTTHAWWNGSKNESWGGYGNGNFGFTTAQINYIVNAIADSTKSVTINFDLCVVKPTGSTITATKLNAQTNAVNYNINYDTWSTATFDLSAWTQDQLTKCLNGTTQILSLQGAWTGVTNTSNADSEVHIYLDRIYISITDKA